MTERFRLAANALLKRRLNNLVRIDNNIKIDRDFITCAEYQLFIDDMRQKGKNRQPDHWTFERFPPGDAKQPITGIRSSDAEEFCAWLTKKEAVPGFKYRLPKLAETKEILATRNDIGFWCKDHDTFAISGITAQRWQTWQQKLSQCFIFKGDFVLDLDLYQDLDLYRDLDLYQDLDQYLDQYLNLYLDLYRDLDQYRDRYLDLYRDLDRYLYLDLYLDLYRYLDRDLYRFQDRYLDLYLDRYQDRYLDLYLDRFQDRYLDRYLYLYFYREIKSGQASIFLLIYFPLLIPILFYQSFSNIYSEVARNRKIRQKINLNRQDCEQESIKYARKRDEIFRLYAYLVLMDQRQKGNMPAWEGIRIVREREEID